MPETTLPRVLVACIRIHGALGAISFICVFTDWIALRPWTLPPMAFAIFIVGALFVAGFGALIISMHENLLRMLRHRPDVVAPFARWFLLVMILLGALPVARFGDPVYGLLIAGMTITGVTAFIALQKLSRSNATSA